MSSASTLSWSMCQVGCSSACRCMRTYSHGLRAR
jgi:hypothetical protein